MIKEVYDNMRVHGMEYFKTHTKKQQILFEGCLTVHLPHEIILNANAMKQGDFVNVFLARHVSGTYAHHQKH